MHSIPVQSLYSPIEDREVSIEVHRDTLTKCLFIRWEDIQSSFASEVFLVRAGHVDVKFMVDSSFKNLEPLRIRYYPNVQLTVVFKSEIQDARMPAMSSTSLCRILETTETMAHIIVILLLGLMTSVRPLAGLGHSFPLESQRAQPSPTAVREDDVQTPHEPQETRCLLEATAQSDPCLPSEFVSSDYLEAGRDDPLWPIHLATFESPASQSLLKPECDNMVPPKTCLPASHEVSFSNEDQSICDVRPGESLGAQTPGRSTNSTDRLAFIYGHMRTLLLHDYKLFENPSPRLFIVLPSLPRIDFASRVTPKFKLFFLCECSNHIEPTAATVSSSPNICPRHIHLAKHEGYDLQRQNEFFATFGRHVLTVLEMVKYGISMMHIKVPPMVTLKLLSGTEDLKCHDTIRETMCSKVDYTIKYIRDQLNITEDTLDWKPLDSETLNLVGNFVQNGDQGLGLGNLYRTITAQGEVKWICLDHYRNIHQSLLTERLSGVGLAHVDNHLGRVSIQLSREEAKDFYKGLRKTPTVYALCIAFSVNATEADLQGLCNAIQASNVAVLSLSDPALDSTAVRSHTSHRLAPLVKLLASGRLQALHTRGSELLYSTLGETSMTIPKLHELQLGIEDISQDIGQRFASLVQSFPRLKHLSLDCDDMKMAFELILAHIEGLQFLSTLTLSTVLNTSVLHRETMVWEWSSVGCNFDDILQIDDEPMSIILPYIEDTLADDIVWFDTLFERRQSQLRVAFVGGRSETIVEVEYRHPESDHNGIVGQYLHGLHSAMYVRWREIRSRESLGWQSSGQDAVALDFQAMKNQGIRRILQSVDMLEPTELQVALCKMDEPVVQLVVSSIRPTSWVNLTRLDLRGRGCDLDNWIVGFVNYGPCFSRVAMPSLRVLCLVGAASVLSDDSVKWIESMLWRDSTEVQALDTITLESIDLTEGQWDTVLSAIELPEVKFLSFAGSTIGLIHIEILLKDLPIGAKLAHLVLNNIGWVKDLKDARSKDLKELELELFKKSALARMHN